jgi:uncharacterized damage-inducible protein DinB
MSANDLARELTAYAGDKLQQQLGQIRRCAARLSDDEIWHRSNPHTNAIGNLILHLTGNVQQWIVAGLGGIPADRDRPAEFAARGPVPASEIVERLGSVVADAIAIIEELDADALLRRRVIQGYTVSGLTAVFHVVEHFSGHTGQIVHITKLLKDVDLSLYDAQGRRADDVRP